VAIFLAGIISVVVTFYFGFLLSTIIASPFNSILAEKTLAYKNSHLEKPINFSRWLKITLRQLSISLVRALIFAFIGLIIFVFSFVPLLNFLAAFAAFLIVAFDCIDYGMEVKLMGLKSRLAYFRQHFSVFSGMAMMLGLTLMVPGLTLILLPCAVVGAADTMSLIEERTK
jgi:CysZ protein